MKRILALLTLALVVPAGAQPVNALVAATNSLATLAQLTTSRNFDKLGFASTNETSLMVLGEPVPLYLLGAPQLYLPTASTNVGVLFVATNVTSYLYPVLVGTNVRTSFTLQKHGNRWRGTAYGDAAFARSLVTTRTNLLPPLSPAFSNSFAVRIPSLSADFLGYWLLDDYHLALLTERATLPLLTAGSATNAVEVLRQVRAAIDEKSGFPE